MEKNGLNVVFKSLTVLFVLLLLLVGINLVSASVTGYSVFDIPTRFISLPGFGGSAPSGTQLPGAGAPRSTLPSTQQGDYFLWMKFEDGLKNTISGNVAGSAYEGKQVTRVPRPDDQNNKALSIQLPTSGAVKLLESNKVGHLEKFTIEVDVDRTATEKVRLYIDGKKVAAGRKYEQPTTSSTSYEMLLGARAQQEADTQYFGGLIDNLKLSRKSLAQADEEDIGEVAEQDSTAEVTVTTDTKAETPTGTVDLSVGSNFFANLVDLKTVLPTKTETTIEEAVEVSLPTGMKTLPAGTKINLNVGTLVPPPTEAGSKIAISSEILLKALTEAKTPSGEIVKLPASTNLKLPAGTKILIQAPKIPVHIQVPISVKTPQGIIELPAGTRIPLTLGNLKTTPKVKVPLGILKGGGSKGGKKTHSVDDLIGLQDFVKKNSLLSIYTTEGKKCTDVCKTVGDENPDKSITYNCIASYESTNGNHKPCDNTVPAARTCICSPTKSTSSTTSITSTKLPTAHIKLPAGFNLGQ